MNRTVMIVSQHYPPEIGAASSRIDHLSNHLAEHGREVIIVTSQPTYPNRSLYSKMPYKEFASHGIIYRIPLLSFAQSGIMARIIQQLSFILLATLMTVYLAIRYKIKICITTSPPFGVNMIGWIYRYTGWKRRWIMEVRDLWPDSMIAVGATHENSLLYKILKFLERRLYHASSNIVVVTPQTKNILLHQKILSSKISIITNGIPDWVQDIAYKKTKTEKFTVLYAGNLGKSQNLSQLIYAAKRVSNIDFYLIGDGLEKKLLIDIVKSENLNNVKFVSAILNKKDLIEWYQKADIGIISLKNAELFSHVIPSKLFEYAGMNLPVLYIGQGEGAELVNKYQLGRVVKPNKDDIINEILYMYDNIKYYRENNVERQRFIEIYRWKNLSNEYMKLLKQKEMS